MNNFSGPQRRPTQTLNGYSVYLDVFGQGSSGERVLLRFEITGAQRRDWQHLQASVRPRLFKDMA